MVCVDLVGPFTIRTQTKTHSLLAITIIDPETALCISCIGWFVIVEVINKSVSSIRICFITPGWHVTWNLNLLSLTMGANSNLNAYNNVKINMQKGIVSTRESEYP
jgi:hypothetical protein